MNSTSTARAWASGIRGLYEHQAKWRMLLWESRARVNYVQNGTLVRPEYGADGWRRVPAVLTYDAYGWQCTSTTLYLLAPLTIMCLVGLSLFIAGGHLGGPLLQFDPTDIESLLTAVANGNLASATSKSPAFGTTRIRFRHNVDRPLERWGLFI